MDCKGTREENVKVTLHVNVFPSSFLATGLGEVLLVFTFFCGRVSVSPPTDRFLLDFFKTRKPRPNRKIELNSCDSILR